MGIIEIKLPPLRYRGTDKLILAERYLHERCERYNKQLSLDDSAKQFIMEYQWPENVRELKKIMERAVILYPTANGTIDAGYLKKHTGIRERQELAVPDNVFREVIEQKFKMAQGNSIEYRAFVEAFGKAVINYAMAQAGDNKRQAAIMLGIPRTTLIDNLQRYGPHTDTKTEPR